MNHPVNSPGCIADELTAKLTPVQRMVADLLHDVSRAGSTFHKMSTAEKRSHSERFDAVIRLDHDKYRVLKKLEIFPNIRIYFLSLTYKSF